MASIRVMSLTISVTLTLLCVLTCHGYDVADTARHRVRRTLINGGSLLKNEDTIGTSFLSKLAYNSQTRLKRATEQKDVENNEQEVEQVVVVEKKEGADYNVKERSGKRETASNQYGILLDAGSSSTKAKLYKYTAGSAPSFVPDVRLESSQKTKPGLSHFVHRLPELRAYLEGILAPLMLQVDQSHHAATPIYLKATAGLRTLPVSDAKALLDATRDVLMNGTINPFRFQKEHVSILAGEEEALYAWLAVNYLKGFFSSRMTPKDSVGVLEMGGGSMQVAFLPDGPLYQEEFQVYVGPRRFDIYAQTYLNYGSNYITKQVRTRLMEERGAGVLKDGGKLCSPCLLAGDESTFQPNSSMTVTVTGTGDPAQCEEVLTRILQPATGIRCSPKPCTIGDTYQPSVGALPFYAISAFRYAPQTLGAIDSDGILNITKLRINALSYCSLTVAEAVKRTGTKPKYASNNCLMGLYIPMLLTKSLGFKADTRAISVVQHIDNREIDWALGAMVQQLSMTFLDDLQSQIRCRQGDQPIQLSVDETQDVVIPSSTGSTPFLHENGVDHEGW